MALKLKIKVPNGIELNYHIISNINIDKDKIKIKLDSFSSDKYYKTAIIKKNLIKSQNSLIEELNTLSNNDIVSKDKDKKIEKLKTKINDLYNQIKEAKDYDNYVLGNINIEIPYIENISIETIEQELLNTKQFKLAQII